MACVLKCSFTFNLPSDVEASCTRWKQPSNVHVQRSPGPCGSVDGRSYFTTLSSRYVRVRKFGLGVASGDKRSARGFVKSSRSLALCIIVMGGLSGCARSSLFSSFRLSPDSCVARRPFLRAAAFFEYLPPLGWSTDLCFRPTTLIFLLSSSSEKMSTAWVACGVFTTSPLGRRCIRDSACCAALRLCFLLGSIGSSGGDCDFLFLVLSMQSLLSFEAASNLICAAGTGRKTLAAIMPYSS